MNESNNIQFLRNLLFADGGENHKKLEPAKL